MTDSDQKFYLMLRGYAELHGFKPGWAFIQFYEAKGYRPARWWNTLPTLAPSQDVGAWVHSRLGEYAKGRGENG